MNGRELDERFLVGDEIWACNVRVNNRLDVVDIEGMVPRKGICAPYDGGCPSNLQYFTEKYKGTKGITLFVPIVDGKPLWSAAKSTLFYLFGETEEECREVYKNLLANLSENVNKKITGMIESL